jgi:hypothetical protein
MDHFVITSLGEGILEEGTRIAHTPRANLLVPVKVSQGYIIEP